MNIENLTAAQTKAIEAGGTNNAIVGNSLVKRDIMVPNNPDRAIIPFKFVLSSEYVQAHEVEQIDANEEKKFADAMQAEEDATSTSEEYEIANMNSVARMDEIEALSDEFLTCDAERAEEITTRLAELGAEPPVLPMTAHTGDAEQAFAEAVDADDMQAQKEILEGAAPIVLVRDPKETRYAHCDRWTDDNLLIKREILNRRLARRTLLRADRMQAERHLLHVNAEIEARGI